MDNVIVCKVCGQEECFKETENDIDSFLCMGCGYTTTSLNVDDSIELRKWEQTTPELIKKSKFVDPDTNLVWYPSVLNFPNIGMIFPDGTNEDNWNWRVARAVDIPEEDRSKYPVPGKDGEFYTRRIDMKGSKLYERTDFKTACEDLGILQKSENNEA
jgi:hypothetical protein